MCLPAVYVVQYSTLVTTLILVVCCVRVRACVWRTTTIFTGVLAGAHKTLGICVRGNLQLEETRITVIVCGPSSDMCAGDTQNIMDMCAGKLVTQGNYG